MTRRLLPAAALLLAAPLAPAGLLPGEVTLTAEGGNTRFTYAVVLPTDSQLKAGNYFTIYDFAGYIPGTEAAPAGWAFGLANVGPTPVPADPQDDPAVPNLSWTYAGPTADGQVGLGNFGASSEFVDTAPTYFTAQTQTTIGGRTDTNITTTLVPVGTVGTPPGGPTVPEPGTLLLAALGLPAAGLVGRRRGRA